VSQNLSVLAYWIPQLIGQLGTNADPVTCGQLTGFVSTLNSSLAAIAEAITGSATPPGTPVDLTAVVAALTGLATAAASYPAVWTAIAAALGNNLANIATAITTAAPDNTGLIAAIKGVGTETTIAQQFRDAMLTEGLITGTDAQLMSGSPGIIALLEVLIPELHDILKAFHILGADIPGVTIFDAIPAIVEWFKEQWPQVKAMLESLFSTATSPPVKLFLEEIEAIAESLAGAAGAPAIAALQFVAAPALALRNVKPGDQTAAAQETFGRAWALGETAHMLAIISGIVPNGLGPAFSGWAAQVAQAAGFREIAQALHRSVYGIAFARPAAYEVNAATRSLYPAGMNGRRMYARGLLTDAQRDELDSYEGMNTDYAPIMQQAAYRGINARQLLRLIETDIFSASEIADELTFSGMRGVSQARMLKAAPWLATTAERNTLRSQLEAAYVAGLLSDTDLTNQVTAIESNTDLPGLVLQAARWKKLIAETKALEAEYTTLYIGGLIDDPTFRNYLSGIGLQPDMVNIVAGKAEARANATIQRKTIAAAAALERTTLNEERKAAMKNYNSGNIDAAALLAALLLTGLTATQAAAWVDLAVLQKAGGLQWLYGLQLDKPTAILLRERVSALTDQRKRLLITDAQYTAGLTAWGIPDKYINALKAAADAMITPKSSAILLPVATS
jgi:hypothetical protein